MWGRGMRFCATTPRRWPFGKTIHFMQRIGSVLVLVLVVWGCQRPDDSELDDRGRGEAGDPGGSGAEDPEWPMPVPDNQCANLVQRTCGETCEESPACMAATLLTEYAPEECEDALEQPNTFPACALNFCESLLLKTCGDTKDLDDAACATDPGCTTARAIVETFGDGGVTFREDEVTLSSCLQALEDEVVFFPCEENQ